LKFQVNKDVLSEAVSFAVRLLPQRTTLPILGGILIEADANALRLSVFDYEVSAQAEIVAKVETSGQPGRRCTCQAHGHQNETQCPLACTPLLNDGPIPNHGRSVPAPSCMLSSRLHRSTKRWLCSSDSRM
jgi:hypothetical protein